MIALTFLIESAYDEFDGSQTAHDLAMGLLVN